MKKATHEKKKVATPHQNMNEEIKEDLLNESTFSMAENPLKQRLTFSEAKKIVGSPEAAENTAKIEPNKGLLLMEYACLANSQYCVEHSESQESYINKALDLKKYCEDVFPFIRCLHHSPTFDPLMLNTNPFGLFTITLLMNYEHQYCQLLERSLKLSVHLLDKCLRKCDIRVRLLDALEEYEIIGDYAKDTPNKMSGLSVRLKAGAVDRQKFAPTPRRDASNKKSQSPPPKHSLIGYSHQPVYQPQVNPFKKKLSNDFQRGHLTNRVLGTTRGSPIRNKAKPTENVKLTQPSTHRAMLTIHPSEPPLRFADLKLFNVVEQADYDGILFFRDVAVDLDVFNIEVEANEFFESFQQYVNIKDLYERHRTDHNEILIDIKLEQKDIGFVTLNLTDPQGTYIPSATIWVSNEEITEQSQAKKRSGSLHQWVEMLEFNSQDQRESSSVSLLIRPGNYFIKIGKERQFKFLQQSLQVKKGVNVFKLKMQPVVYVTVCFEVIEAGVDDGQIRKVKGAKLSLYNQRCQKMLKGKSDDVGVYVTNVEESTTFSVVAYKEGYFAMIHTFEIGKSKTMGKYTVFLIPERKYSESFAALLIQPQSNPQVALDAIRPEDGKIVGVRWQAWQQNGYRFSVVRVEDCFTTFSIIMKSLKRMEILKNAIKVPPLITGVARIDTSSRDGNLSARNLSTSRTTTQYNSIQKTQAACLTSRAKFGTDKINQSIIPTLKGPLAFRRPVVSPTSVASGRGRLVSISDREKSSSSSVGRIQSKPNQTRYPLPSSRSTSRSRVNATSIDLNISRRGLNAHKEPLLADCAQLVVLINGKLAHINYFEWHDVKEWKAISVSGDGREVHVINEPRTFLYSKASDVHAQLLGKIQAGLRSHHIGDSVQFKKDSLANGLQSNEKEDIQVSATKPEEVLLDHVQNFITKNTEMTTSRILGGNQADIAKANGIDISISAEAKAIDTPPTRKLIRNV